MQNPGFVQVIYPAETVVFREGERADAAYVLLNGEIHISTRNRQGKLVLLTTVRSGEMFGELAMLNNERRTATATTARECRLMVIPKKLIKEKLREADPMVRYWVGYLGQRVIALSKRV